MGEGVMGVGGDVVRLCFKLPNGDLTDNYWVTEKEGESFSFLLYLIK